MSSPLIKFAKFWDPVMGPLSVGPRFIPFNWVINSHKLSTIIVMYSLMYYYQNYSLGAWLYLSLHGAYGIIWIIKDMICPDKSFQHKIGILGSLAIESLLCLYWYIGFLMMSGAGDQNPSPRKIFSCYFVFSIGMILMMCSDLQKYITLSLKKGLIDNYFFARNRNTNYFGEILVYLSFALATNKLSGYIILINIWVIIFGSRIYLKELSLRKKDGYAKYAQNSYLLLFKFFDSDFANVIVYLIIVLIIIACYWF